MAVKNYAWVFYIIVLILIAVGGFYVYKKYVIEPTQTIEKQTKQIQNLSSENQQLKQNATLISAPVIQKQNGWMWFFLLTTIILLLILLFLFIKKPQEIKLRHEIIEHLRKYAMEKDGMKLWKQVSFYLFFYKADENYPYALCSFSTLKTWNSVYDSKRDLQIEPPKQYHYGYLVNAKNLDDVRADFKGETLTEMFKIIQDFGYGLVGGSHFSPYKTKSPMEMAQVELLKEEMRTDKSAKGRAKDIQKTREYLEEPDIYGA